MKTIEKHKFQPILSKSSGSQVLPYNRDWRGFRDEHPITISFAMLAINGFISGIDFLYELS